MNGVIPPILDLSAPFPAETAKRIQMKKTFFRKVLTLKAL